MDGISDLVQPSSLPSVHSCLDHSPAHRVARVRTYRGHPEEASGRHQGRWRVEKCVEERGGAGKEKLLPEQSVRLSLQAAMNSCP